MSVSRSRFSAARVPRRAAALLLFAAALALTLAYMVRELDVEGAPARGGAALTDFRDAFYYPGVALLDGKNPYASNDYLDRYPVGSAYPMYSPASLLAHLPFSLLPYRAAQVFYVTLNVILVLALAALSLRLAGLPATQASIFTVGALLLLARPGHQNLFLGQCTFYVVAGVYLALLHARSRPGLAGAGLAVAALKPTIGAPLALLMLCRGDRKAVLVGVAITAAAGIGMLLPVMHNAGGSEALIASLRENYSVFRSNPYVDSITSLYRIDLIALLARAVSRPLGVIENVLLSAAIVGMSGWVVHRHSRRPGAEVLTASLICLTLMVCTYHLPYDALLLATPAVALVANPAAMGAIGRRPLWRWGSVVLIAVPATSYFATQRAIDAMALSGPSWWVVTSAISAAGGLLFLTWMGLGIGGERQPTAA